MAISKGAATQEPQQLSRPVRLLPAHSKDGPVALAPAPSPAEGDSPMDLLFTALVLRTWPSVHQVVIDCSRDWLGFSYWVFGGKKRTCHPCWPLSVEVNKATTGYNKHERQTLP
ncbi:hypothetical protein MRX96_056581 [Rhipicephalus microplus]